MSIYVSNAMRVCVYIYTRIFDHAQAAADRIQQLHDGFPG